MTNRLTSRLSRHAALLTRVALTLSLAASCAVAQRTDEPNWVNTREVLNYPLTMEKIDKWAGATRGVITYAKSHPEILAKIRGTNEVTVKTLDDLVALAKVKAGEYVAIVESNGIKFREYLLVSGSLIAAMVVVQMSGHGGDASGLPMVNPANVAFVKANKAKLDALFAEYQTLAKGGGQ